MSDATNKAADVARWLSDDKNLRAVLREAERQGFLESYTGPDGKIWYRRTSKPVPGELLGTGTGGLDS
jgi:hypothetical protein